ncbi:MAG: hypothetical protein H7338_17350 [Candidatus Sericytochromatia bacterium]|nr:hypothetical protein [Candidatus Sericytochromatia bacterium]
MGVWTRHTRALAILTACGLGLVVGLPVTAASATPGGAAETTGRFPESQSLTTGTALQTVDVAMVALRQGAWQTAYGAVKRLADRLETLRPDHADSQEGGTVPKHRPDLWVLQDARSSLLATMQAIAREDDRQALTHLATLQTRLRSLADHPAYRR